MTATTTVSADANTLYVVDATALETDVGSVTAGQPRLEINKRQRACAFISGFRFSQYWLNRTARPMVIRWACLSSKNNSSASMTAGFFRSYGNSRDRDFNSANSTLVQSNYPISRDKYTVFYEGKVFLASNGTAEFKTSVENTYGYVDRWLPINRQLQFNDDTTQDCEDKIFFVWWATPIMQDTTSPTLSTIITQTHLITHFRDPLEMVLYKQGISKRKAPTRYRNITRSYGVK